jgi:hypothetical protein
MTASAGAVTPNEGLTRNLIERLWAMASTIAFVPHGEGSFVPGMMTHASGDTPGGMPAAGQAGLTTSTTAAAD